MCLFSNVYLLELESSGVLGGGFNAFLVVTSWENSWKIGLLPVKAKICFEI